MISIKSEERHQNYMSADWTDTAAASRFFVYRESNYCYDRMWQRILRVKALLKFEELSGLLPGKEDKATYHTNTLNHIPSG